MLELLISENRGIVQDVLVWSICLSAFVWGGGPERVVAATWIFLLEIPDGIYLHVRTSGYQVMDVDLVTAAMDVSAGIVWISVALFSNRIYPLWIAGLQVLAVSAHIARGIADSISPIAYITMVVGPGWFQLIIMGFGLVFHILRKRKYGNYRDWRITIPARLTPILGRGPQ